MVWLSNIFCHWFKYARPWRLQNHKNLMNSFLKRRHNSIFFFKYDKSAQQFYNNKVNNVNSSAFSVYFCGKMSVEQQYKVILFFPFSRKVWSLIDFLIFCTFWSQNIGNSTHVDLKSLYSTNKSQRVFRGQYLCGNTPEGYFRSIGLFRRMWKHRVWGSCCHFLVCLFHLVLLGFTVCRITKPTVYSY